MKNFIILLIISLIQFSIGWSQKINSNNKDEIIYHVFLRSFFDSNGDTQGDLNRLKQKLSFLHELGITSTLLLPLYNGDCCYNYFENDFEKIDTEFGTIQYSILLVKDEHNWGMKIYRDIETRYVAEKHLWWRVAVGNSKSMFSDSILFDESALTIPATIVTDNNNKRVFIFYRIYNHRSVLVIINFTEDKQIAVFVDAYKSLITQFVKNEIKKKSIKLSPFEEAVFEIK